MNECRAQDDWFECYHLPQRCSALLICTTADGLAFAGTLCRRVRALTKGRAISLAGLDSGHQDASRPGVQAWTILSRPNRNDRAGGIA